MEHRERCEDVQPLWQLFNFRAGAQVENTTQANIQWVAGGQANHVNPRNNDPIYDLVAVDSESSMSIELQLDDYLAIASLARIGETPSLTLSLLEY